jgi:hypothetical protein
MPMSFAGIAICAGDILNQGLKKWKREGKIIFALQQPSRENSLKNPILNTL